MAVRRRQLALWPGLFVPPITFLGWLTAAYALVPLACATRQPGLLHVASAVALSLTLVGGLIAWRDWRAAGHVVAGEGESGARSRFLALVGLLVSSMFALVLVAAWFTALVVPACQP